MHLTLYFILLLKIPSLRREQVICDIALGHFKDINANHLRAGFKYKYFVAGCETYVVEED